MKLLPIVFASAAALSAIVCSGPAHASTLYTDPESSYGYANPYTAGLPINNGTSISDEFTLAGPSDVTGFEFVLWNAPSETTTSVDWTITSSNFGGTTFASGTASTPDLSGTYLTSTGGHDIYQEAFSVPNVTLSGSSPYYFELSNAVAIGGGQVFWDDDFGNTNGYEYTVYSPPGGYATYGENFSVLGAPAAAPESSSISILLAALAGLAGYARFASRKQS